MAIKLTNALKAALYGSVGHLEIMLIMYTLIQNKIIIFMFLKREMCVYKLFRKLIKVLTPLDVVLLTFAA